MKRRTKIILGIASFAIIAYAIDVIIRPKLIANKVLKQAKENNKPVLNMGAGTPDSSLRTALFGPTLWGDVNMDIATMHTEYRVSWRHTEHPLSGQVLRSRDCIARC